MNSEKQLSLWEIIDISIQQIPLTKEKVEQSLRITLSEVPEESNKYFVAYSSRNNIDLLGGVKVSQVNVRLKRAGGHPGLLNFAIDGACVRLNDIMQKFPSNRLLSSPRGDSLSEMWMYGTEQPLIRFGFKVSNRDCLAYVGFYGADT